MSVEVARAQYDFGSTSSTPKKRLPSDSNLTQPADILPPLMIEQRMPHEVHSVPSLPSAAVEVQCECSVELLKASYLQNSKKENRVLEPFDCDFSAFLRTNPAAPGDSWRSCRFSKVYHLC
jgi:hypothetical protein